MLDILFITPGPITWASTRYRAIWLLDYLENSGALSIRNIEANGKIPQAKNYIWIKTGDAGLMSQLEGKHYLDYCDPLWWFSPNEVRAAADLAEATIASSQDLANDFEHWSGKPALVIPDCLKLSHYQYQREHNNTPPTRYIWYGSAQNRPSLWGALPVLERLTSNGVKVELTILDNDPQNRWGVELKFPVYNVMWELEKENAILSAHDIALTPRYPGPWGGVKSNNKTITAWAFGLAVDDISDYDKSFELATKASVRQQQADNGLQTVKDYYQSEHAAAMWRELLDV